MAQIKLNFSRLSIPEKIARARQIVTAMTGNAHFTAPQPPLTSITTAANELDQAASDVQAARQEAKTKTTIQNAKEDALDKLISQEGGYVTAVAGGDEAIIQSASMDVRAAPGASAIPAQPQALSATAGDRDGQMDLSWDPVVSATSYVLETSLDPPTATSWKHLGVSTKSSFTVTDLVSGSRVWFRVSAVNAAGQSGWSDPATKIVP
jgi:Fibronectin type III domain